MQNDIIQNILTADLGLNELPKETRERILINLGENILKKLLIIVLDNLPDEDYRNKFEKITKNENDEELRDFLLTHIPNFDALMQEEVKKGIEDFKKMKKEITG